MAAPDPRRILAILPATILAVGLVMLMLGVEKMVMDFKATFLLGVGVLFALAGLGSALVLPPTAGDTDDEEVVVHKAPSEAPKVETPAGSVEAHLSKEERDTLTRVESEERDLKIRVDELSKALETARAEAHDGLDSAGAGAAESAERITELAARVDAIEEQLNAPGKGPDNETTRDEYGGAMAQPQPPPAPPGASIAEHISPVGAVVRPPPEPEPEPTDDEEPEEDKGPEGFPCNTCGFVNKRRTAFCSRCGAKM